MSDIKYKKIEYLHSYLCAHCGTDSDLVSVNVTYFNDVVNDIDVCRDCLTKMELECEATECFHCGIEGVEFVTSKYEPVKICENCYESDLESEEE